MLADFGREGGCGSRLVLWAVAFEDGGQHHSVHGKPLSGDQVFTREEPRFLGFWLNCVQVLTIA